MPPPAHDWDAATWILGAIGDAEFLRGNYAAARDDLQDAVVYCPDGLGNPFLHMRLGEAQYELGNRERAADELIRAYAMGDPDLWADEDPKYLDYLATVCADIKNYSRLH